MPLVSFAGGFLSLMKINIKAKGISALSQSLKRKSDALSHLSPYWQLVGMYVQKQTIKERFDKEQTPDGEKWKPLSPARVKQRRKRHKRGNMKILQDTGELRRSIHYEAGQRGVRIGSNLKYARTHQFGRGNIPARPFLGVTPDERKHIRQMLTAYIKRHSFLGG